jgi:K+-sensing histidine kinase KdpD
LRGSVRTHGPALVGAVAGPALVTLLTFTDADAAIPRALYIAAIALAALGGTVPGLVAAAISFVAFTEAFAPPPLESLGISNFSEAVSLVVFVGVAFAVGQLVARERRARRKSEAAAADTRRLEAVARALGRARKPQEVLDVILTEGLAAAEARAGLIGVLTDEGKTVEVIAQRGYDNVRFDRWGRFGVDEQLPLSEAIRTGRPVFLASTAERDERYPLLAGLTETSHALACLPLVFEGRTIGGLVLSFPTDQVFDAERRALKEALAAQAAQALDLARLDEAERDLRERLAFLAQASAVLSYSLDEERTLRRLVELCVPRLGDRCEVDLGTEDSSVELSASRIRVPLIARGRALCALVLELDGSERQYGQADLELAVDLAHRAAVAVDNARLHEEVERRADAARALQYVADAVVLVGRDGRPRYWNAAAGELLGETEALDQWKQVRAQLENEDTMTAPVTLPVQLDGRERWVQISRAEFEEGCVYALRDVTEERSLERTRSEFVATASHELRTPIAAVYGTFQTLLREDIELDPERQQQFLRLGLQESDRLRRIVEDVLLAGELNAGNPELTAGACDVQELLAELVESTQRRIDGKHTLVLDVQPEVGAVECDPLRLRQVLANLIENAIKYSPKGGNVTVSAARSDGAVRIEVADQGIGIAEDDHERIFERFVRVDPALSSGVGGTGLGLYICRELVERMQGAISVDSRQGAGSTFAVELPVTRGV